MTPPRAQTSRNEQGRSAYRAAKRNGYPKCTALFTVRSPYMSALWSAPHFSAECAAVVSLQEVDTADEETAVIEDIANAMQRPSTLDASGSADDLIPIPAGDFLAEVTNEVR